MKFLFSPMGTHGFVYPSVGIAKELKQRGYEVAFVTSRDFAEFFKQEGLNRIPNGRRDRQSFEIPKWGGSIHISIQLKHIEYALERFMPDVLIGSLLGFGSIFAGKIHELPTAIIGTSTYLFATPETLKHPYLLSAPEKRAVWRSNDFRKTYNEAGTLFQFQPMTENDFIGDMPLLGDLFFLRNLPDLIENSSELPQKVHLIGACNWETSIKAPELESWLKEAKISGYPILYVQPGAHFGAPSFWPFLVEALSEQPIKVVASIGRKVGVLSHLSLYPNNFYVRDHIPQNQVLPYADGIVSEGHTSVVLGALTHGVPLMLIPYGGEEIECAEMCIRAGICVGINHKDISVKSIKEKIQELIQRPDIRNKAKKIKTLFKKSNSYQNAADLLEHLAITRRPMLRSEIPAGS